MRSLILVITTLMLTLAATGNAHAHGGGLDAFGCHNDRKQGGYHCHRGPLAGQTFKSKGEAQKVSRDTNSPSPNSLKGRVRVIDGDTIELSGQRIRLHGIDAPEMKQTCRTKKGQDQQCGELARQALSQMVRNQKVTCKGTERDKYKRIIAVCYVGPFDLNEQMVLDGWALAYRKYSEDYVRAEDFAKSRHEGIWKTKFMLPWEWRRK